MCVTWCIWNHNGSRTRNIPKTLHKSTYLIPDNGFPVSFASSYGPQLQSSMQENHSFFSAFVFVVLFYFIES